MMRVRFVLILGLTLLSWTVAAQSAVTPEERKAANNYFQASDWSKSAKAYESIANREPQNAGARLRWGQSLLRLGDPRAIDILTQAAHLGPNPQAYYSLAAAYALNKNADAAFDNLDKALKAGFNQRKAFINDKDFDAIRTDKRYASLVDRLERGVSPCRFQPEASQFDFWLGDWDVQGVNGQRAGESHVEKILGECVIFENWTSAAPNEYSGKSFNFFDTASGKWRQNWVDDKGGSLDFINGIYADGKMVFVTLADARNQITRLTFYHIDKDHVRQQFEVTTDDGKTWSTTTDLHYFRSKK